MSLTPERLEALAAEAEAVGKQSLDLARRLRVEADRVREDARPQREREKTTHADRRPARSKREAVQAAAGKRKPPKKAPAVRRAGLALTGGVA